MTVSGPFTLAPKQTLTYSFFLNNGQWRSYNEVIADPRMLSAIPRPRSELPRWSVVATQTQVVLLRNGNSFRHLYAVVVENPTDTNVQFDFVASIS